MSPEDTKTSLQLLTAEEFTRNSLGQTNLRKNSPYPDENKEFQGGGGGGVTKPQIPIMERTRP